MIVTAHHIRTVALGIYAALHGDDPAVSFMCVQCGMRSACVLQQHCNSGEHAANPTPTTMREASKPCMLRMSRGGKASALSLHVPARFVQIVFRCGSMHMVEWSSKSLSEKAARSV